MKRVLVTGASGFIGRQSLEPLLTRGFEVHATYRDTAIKLPGVVWHKTDLLQEDSGAQLCAKIKPSHLLHFAWYVDPTDYKTSPQNTVWADISISLCKSFWESGGTRAVLAGTCMEYDWSTPQEFLSETRSPLAPSTWYGKEKLRTFLELSHYANSYGFDFAWGRIFLLYGPYEHPQRLVPYVITSLLRNEPALCTSGEQVRDILYVRDVADAFCALLESKVTGAVNIGSGIPICLKESIGHIAESIGKPELVRLGAIEGRNDPRRLVFDIARLRDEVGWRPSHSLREGLDETIAWWKTRRGRGR